MTLTDLLPSIKNLEPAEKIKLIRILAEELEADKSIESLKRNHTYILPTPYHSYGAGEILMETLNRTQSKGNAF